MEYRLKDRIAVITGRSSGIGFATVTLLLGEGARVVFCGRDCSTARCRHEQANRALWPRANSVPSGGRVPHGFVGTTDEAWRAERDLKFFSIIYPTRAFLPLLERDRDPAIVCTNALLAVRPEAHMTATSPLASFIAGTALDVSGGQADHV